MRTILIIFYQCEKGKCCPILVRQAIRRAQTRTGRRESHCLLNPKGQWHRADNAFLVTQGRRIAQAQDDVARLADVVTTAQFTGSGPIGFIGQVGDAEVRRPVLVEYVGSARIPYSAPPLRKPMSVLSSAWYR